MKRRKQRIATVDTLVVERHQHTMGAVDGGAVQLQNSSQFNDCDYRAGDLAADGFEISTGRSGACRCPRGLTLGLIPKR